MAKKLMVTMKVTKEAKVLQKYTQHLTILVSTNLFHLATLNYKYMYMQRLFVREQSEKASAPGKLYIDFRQWMRETFPHGPKWDFIMAQDEANGHSIELETVSSDELSGMESSQDL